MQTFSMTDTGLARSNNQDSVFCSENAVGRFPNLFIVADGMGGHNAGDIASRLGIETAVNQIRISEKPTIVGLLDDAVQTANKAISKEARKDASLDGMGTTFVATTVMGDTAYVINVGDSRLYHLSDTLKQITQDHSLVEEMVRNGEIKKEEMRTHPNKNIITRALGTLDDVRTDCFEISVKEGDVLLLCSDGLTNMVDDDLIEKTIRETVDSENPEESIQKAGRELIELANDAGGKDNISVILVRI